MHIKVIDCLGDGRALLMAREVIEPATKWEVGDGETIRIRDD